jgi:hypothetical protein
MTLKGARRIKQILILISLPLVMWLFFSQSAFWHFHVTPSGIIIEHSHPFTNNSFPDSPFQKHHHSDFEYSTLSQLSNVLSLVVIIMAVILVLQQNQLKPYQNIDLILIKARACLNSHQLRGPPVS